MQSKCLHETCKKNSTTLNSLFTQANGTHKKCSKQHEIKMETEKKQKYSSNSQQCMSDRIEKGAENSQQQQQQQHTLIFGGIAKKTAFLLIKVN